LLLRGFVKVHVPYSNAVNPAASEIGTCKIGLNQCRPPEVRPAEVRVEEVSSIEVRPSEVRPDEDRLAEDRPAEVHHNFRFFGSPSVPNLDALPEEVEMLCGGH
jgi:hypothetical protein